MTEKWLGLIIKNITFFSIASHQNYCFLVPTFLSLLMIFFISGKSDIIIIIIIIIIEKKWCFSGL